MNPQTPLSHKFIACTVNEKGKFNSYDTNLTYGLAAATLIELQNAGAIEIREKYAKPIAACPEDKPWLKKAHDALSNPLNEASIAEMFRKLYAPVFSDRRTWPTLETYFLPMEKNGCGQMTHGTVFPCPLFKPNPLFLSRLHKKIERQLNGEEPHDIETATLTMLLHHSHRLKNVIPHMTKRDAKRSYQKIERIDKEPFKSKLQKNRDVIASLSFATSLLGGGMF